MVVNITKSSFDKDNVEYLSLSKTYKRQVIPCCSECK